MEIVLKINGSDFAKVKDMLLKDETVNRGSMTFKEGKEFGQARAADAKSKNQDKKAGKAKGKKAP